VTSTLVAVNELSKVFSPKLPPALEQVSVNFSSGQIIGVVGPDGAGKTTFIRLLAALLLPTHGNIEIAGYDTVEDAEFIHYLTGYMPQRFGLYEDLTVIQNLNLYADLRGVNGQERKEAFEKLLHFTGLVPFSDRLARNLSGGMKQKLGLACALIKKPTVLLLDEPSVGVDPLSRRELWKMVQSLISEEITVFWSTSYLDEAERCHSVLLLSEGNVLYTGSPQELNKRVEGRVFKVTEIAGDRRKLLFELLKDPNILDGVIQGRDLRILMKNHSSLSQSIQAKIEPTQPRFEDAFIDILGGGPGGKSELAERAAEVKDKAADMVVAENLTKKFGNFTAADKISFQVRKGEIFGLLGPNGAGKSTIFKMLCGLLRPTDGKAIVCGLDLQVALGDARAEIGYMAQKFSLYGNLTVQQNLEFFAGIYNLTNAQKEKAVEQMIEIFALQPFLEQSADSLPLGFKQRLSLACATMHNPSLLFLDEPTSGVDPLTRREFWNHINGLVGKGVTILVTTHFMDEAEYCDRIALIYRGKIIALETPNQLKDLVRSNQNPNPTLEDAFVKMIEEYDTNHPI
jgi:ABC-2 type transport system ATP-binding protein